MKTVTHVGLRFAVSLFAYAAYFLMPQYNPTDAWQDFTDSSLSVVAIIFLVPVVIRGPSVRARIAALLVILPLALYLSMFLYVAIPEFIRYGHRVYADA